MVVVGGLDVVITSDLFIYQLLDKITVSTTKTRKGVVQIEYSFLFILVTDEIFKQTTGAL